jgi:methylphosphotriester-DNA--protein-cysteine methyltransferase
LKASGLAEANTANSRLASAIIEVFSEQVGMTPKRYLRVRRFQRALRLVTSQESPPWTQVAVDCGYFDVKDNHLALP